MLNSSNAHAGRCVCETQNVLIGFDPEWVHEIETPNESRCQDWVEAGGSRRQWGRDTRKEERRRRRDREKVRGKKWFQIVLWKFAKSFFFAVRELCSDFFLIRTWAMGYRAVIAWRWLLWRILLLCRCDGSGGNDFICESCGENGWHSQWRLKRGILLNLREGDRRGGGAMRSHIQ